jgi:hypothetical protein
MSTALYLSDNVDTDDDVREHEESAKEVDDDDDDYLSDSSYESDSSDDEDVSNRTLLFLCEEGQLDKALIRVREWDKRCPPCSGDNPKKKKMRAVDDDDKTTRSIIKQELFRKNIHTGNYCLHEILAGGICDKSALELVEHILERYRIDYLNESRNIIFKAQPKDSHKRTVLHWCAWSKVPSYILKQVINANPECMLLKDNASHGSRTPLEIAKRYWSDDPITKILKSSLDSYLPYRIQFNVHLCINRIFKLSQHNDADDARNFLTPFNKIDRKITGLTPRTWFVASVIGYTMSREMNNLALHIISYMGYGAKKTNKRSKNTKKRRLTMTTKVATIKRKGQGVGNSGNRDGNEETSSNNEESSKMRTRSSKKRKIYRSSVPD